MTNNFQTLIMDLYKYSLGLMHMNEIILVGKDTYKSILTSQMISFPNLKIHEPPSVYFQNFRYESS